VVMTAAVPVRPRAPVRAPSDARSAGAETQSTAGVRPQGGGRLTAGMLHRPWTIPGGWRLIKKKTGGHFGKFKMGFIWEVCVVLVCSVL